MRYAAIMVIAAAGLVCGCDGQKWKRFEHGEIAFQVRARLTRPKVSQAQPQVPIGPDGPTVSLPGGTATPQVTIEVKLLSVDDHSLERIGITFGEEMIEWPVSVEDKDPWLPPMAVGGGVNILGGGRRDHRDSHWPDDERSGSRLDDERGGSSFRVGAGAPLKVGANKKPTHILAKFENIALMERLDETYVMLEIAPRISTTKGYITLAIVPLTSKTPATTPVVQDPPVKTPTVPDRTASTQVVLKDGGTLIIGGLLDSEVANPPKLPILGKIPVLGRLFKSQRDQPLKTETIIFVTPHVLDTP